MELLNRVCAKSGIEFPHSVTRVIKLQKIPQNYTKSSVSVGTEVKNYQYLEFYYSPESFNLSPSPRIPK